MPVLLTSLSSIADKKGIKPLIKESHVDVSAA
jgi:hypothetical protein